MSFPTTPVLDNANRANEDPISQGGNWAQSFGDSNPFRVVSNQILPNASTFSGSVYSPTYGPDTEVYITIATRQSGSSAFIYLAYRLTNPGGTFTAYELKIPANTGSSTWTLYKIIAGAATVLNTWTQAISNGDSVGMEATGNSHQPRHKPSAGSWGAVGSPYSDSSITGAGQIGLEGDVYGPGQTFDDFGGGTIVTASDKSPAVKTLVAPPVAVVQRAAVWAKEWRRSRSGIFVPGGSWAVT